jgi:hypothetical protein
MARLIPSFVDEHTPPGEKSVFDLLAAGPHDWTAIHSLELSPWNRGKRTEIDFVLVVPDTGILCIEVKSHENISFDGDRWYPEEIKRSPFKQAADGRYTFFRRLKEKFPQFKHIPVVHLCIFPRARFDLREILSVQQWELMDNRSFRQFGSGIEFCSNLKERMIRSIDVDQDLRPMRAPLSAEQIQSIVEACVPVQRRRPDLKEEIKRKEEELESVLRIQQKPVLTAVRWNPRLVVTGGAGTGKTLIAMEVAQRAARQGRRVGLLAFNQLVASWMENQISKAEPPPNLIVGSATKVMAEMVDLVLPKNPSPGYWKEEFPQALEERITDPDLRSSAAFDFMVIDEAQDFLSRPRLWECLDHFLERGFVKGSYTIFGDFENQVLSDKRLMDKTLDDLQSSSQPMRWHLDENCRNFETVGETAVQLSGLGNNVYAGYKRTGGGSQSYDIFFYRNDQEQRTKLQEWLKELKAKHYQPGDITLLSFCAPERSLAFRLKQEGSDFRPCRAANDHTGFASIHAFKGMENKVIILTDVTLGEPEFYRHLFYTGMTRATEMVRVLCDESAKQTLSNWILGPRNL